MAETLVCRDGEIAEPESPRPVSGALPFWQQNWGVT